jgi:hypothetical protein
MVKNTITSSARRTRVLSATPSGSRPSVRSKPSGAPISATRDPTLIPSFFGSGVPE